MVIELNSPEYNELEPIRQLDVVIFNYNSDFHRSTGFLYGRPALGLVAGYSIDITAYSTTDRDKFSSQEMEQMDRFLKRYGFTIRMYEIKFPRMLDDIKKLCITLDIERCNKKEDD